MLTGHITKQRGSYWAAEVRALGLFTQGKSRRDATLMLKDVVEQAINRKGVKVTARQRRVDDEGAWLRVSCDRPGVMAALAVKYACDVRGYSDERARALGWLLLKASTPRDAVKPILRRVSKTRVQKCKAAEIPRGALRAYISELCSRAKIPVRSTYFRDIYVYRGRRKIRTTAFDIVGVPMSPHSREGAMRALEILAYDFREHHARFCVVGRGYFTTKRHRAK